MKIKEGWNGKRKERRRTEAVGGRGWVSLARTNETGPVSELYNSTTFLRSCPAETRRFTQDNFHVRCNDNGRRWPPRW